MKVADPELVEFLTVIGDAFTALKDSADPVDEATVADLMSLRSELLCYGADEHVRLRMRALRRRLARRGLQAPPKIKKN